MNLRDSLFELLRDAGPGKMMNTAYDTAWVARLGELDKEISDQALDWIARHQLRDGSWGAGETRYYHDRVISTLAAMIALSKRGRRAVDQFQIERGQMALDALTRGATKGLLGDPNAATIGFEMIVPTLLAEAESLGIIQSQQGHILSRLSNQREAKMALLNGLKINRFVTVAFSAEMAGVNGRELFDVDNLQEANGSVGYSPSATAYFAIYIRPQDPAALEYIRRSIKNGGVPFATPFEVFERSWILSNVALLNDLDDEMLALCKPHLDFLLAAWKPGKGVGFAVGYTPKDGDDTNITYKVLTQFGFSVDLDAVFSYELEKHFQCYSFEVNPSVSANIHALDALRHAGLTKDHPSVQKVLKFLLETRVFGAYWFDKWHTSPYYTTSHAIIALTNYKDDLAVAAVEWILQTQNKDGSWGCYFPSAEETAYCLQALSIWKRSGGKFPNAAIEMGAVWLEDHIEDPYPPLWIGKCLYCPELIVRSTILTALMLVKNLG